MHGKSEIETFTEKLKLAEQKKKEAEVDLQKVRADASKMDNITASNNLLEAEASLKGLCGTRYSLSPTHVMKMLPLN